MIISHSHRFIFIKTRKTAGTSLQEALAALCTEGDIVTPTGINDPAYRPRNYRGMVNPIPYLLRHPVRHRRTRILQRVVQGERIFDHMFLDELFSLSESKRWRNYFKFCIERNPWDKVVSRYFWKYRGRPERPDFETFVAADGLVSDYDMYCLDGKPAVDYIGRFESLAESVIEISRHIGCPVAAPGRRNVAVRTNGDHRDMYSETSREIVARHFAREIDFLGYRFD